MTKRASTSYPKRSSRRRSLNHLKTGGPTSKALSLTSSHEISSSHENLGSDALPTTGVMRSPAESWTFTGTPFQVGMTLCGRYYLERELGRGGMGVVYLATDLRYQESCAIKALYPMLPKDALEEEFGLAEKLDHPYIIRMDRLEEEPSSKIFFVVMEYVAGRSLEDYFEEALAKGAPFFLDDEMLRDFLEQLTDALDFAHSQGVIHRDLKPQNILLADDGTLRILDFSIAKRLEAQTVYMTNQRGTPVYMAPEQITGNSRLTPAVDVYAVGAMIYQGLTGILPYGRLRPPSELLQSQGSPLPFDERLDHVLLQALEHDPKDRFSSMDAFAMAITRTLDDAQRQGSPKPRRPREKPRRPNPQDPRGVATGVTTHPRGAVTQEVREKRREIREEVRKKKKEQRAQAREARREERVAQSQIFRQLQTPKITFWWGLAFWWVVGSFLLSWLYQGGLALGWLHEADMWSWVLLGGLGSGFLLGLGRDDRFGLGAFWMSWIGVLYLGGFVLVGALGVLFFSSFVGNPLAENMALALQEPSLPPWLASVSGAVGVFFVWWVAVPSAKKALENGWGAVLGAGLRGAVRALFFAALLLGGIEAYAHFVLQQSLFLLGPLPLLALGVCLVGLGAVFGVASAFATLWTKRWGLGGYLVGLFVVLALLGGRAEGDIPAPPSPYRASVEMFQASQFFLNVSQQHLLGWLRESKWGAQDSSSQKEPVAPVGLPWSQVPKTFESYRKMKEPHPTSLPQHTEEAQPPHRSPLPAVPQEKAPLRLLVVPKAAKEVLPLPKAKVEKKSKVVAKKSPASRPVQRPTSYPFLNQPFAPPPAEIPPSHFPSPQMP